MENNKTATELLDEARETLARVELLVQELHNACTKLELTSESVRQHAITKDLLIKCFMIGADRMAQLYEDESFTYEGETYRDNFQIDFRIHDICIGDYVQRITESKIVADAMLSEELGAIYKNLPQGESANNY